jgi:hypothetical protein
MDRLSQLAGCSPQTIGFQRNLRENCLLSGSITVHIFVLTVHYIKEYLQKILFGGENVSYYIHTT